MKKLKIMYKYTAKAGGSSLGQTIYQLDEGN